MWRVAECLLVTGFTKCENDQALDLPALVWPPIPRFWYCAPILPLGDSVLL